MIETITFDELQWLHILNPEEEDYTYLLDNYGLHPLDI